MCTLHTQVAGEYGSDPPLVLAVLYRGVGGKGTFHVNPVPVDEQLVESPRCLAAPGLLPRRTTTCRTAARSGDMLSPFLGNGNRRREEAREGWGPGSTVHGHTGPCSHPDAVVEPPVDGDNPAQPGQAKFGPVLVQLHPAPCSLLTLCQQPPGRLVVMNR